MQKSLIGKLYYGLIGICNNYTIYTINNYIIQLTKRKPNNTSDKLGEQLLLFRSGFIKRVVRPFLKQVHQCTVKNIIQKWETFKAVTNLTRKFNPRSDYVMLRETIKNPESYISLLKKAPKILSYSLHVTFEKDWTTAYQDKHLIPNKSIICNFLPKVLNKGCEYLCTCFCFYF